MAEDGKPRTDMARMMAIRAEMKADAKKAASDYAAEARKAREKTARLKALREAREEAEAVAAKPKPARRKRSA